MIFWFKNRFIMDLLSIGIILSVVFLLLIFPYIRDVLNEYNDISVYENTDIDFDIPDPSIEQISDLRSEPFIKAVYPYYLDEQLVSVKNKTRRTNIIIADISHGEFAMYNSARLIEGKMISGLRNKAYIDYIFQNDTGAKIGDKLSFSILGTPVIFEVVAIFETNNRYLNGGAIAVNLSDDIKEIIGEDRAYNQAFIVSSNYIQAFSFLTNDYRPLGRLRDRSLFDSDETYKMHIEMITARTYQNEIVFFKDRLPNEPVEGMRHVGYYLSLVLILLLSIVVNMFFFNKEKGNLKEKILSGGNPRGHYVLTCIFDLVLCLLAMYALIFLCHQIWYEKYYASIVTDVIHIELYLTVVLTCIVCFIINMVLLKRFRKAKIITSSDIAVAISVGYENEISRQKNITDALMEARRAMVSIACYLDKLKCKVYEFHDIAGRTKPSNIKDVIKFHNSKIRDFDISLHFILTANNANNYTSVVKIIYATEKDLADNISKSIINNSRDFNVEVQSTLNSLFLNKTTKPAIIIKIYAAPHEDYNDVCYSIALAVSGKQ